MPVFVKQDGTTGRGRRRPSSSVLVREDDMSDPAKLAAALRFAIGRIAELESASAPQAMDFEVSVDATGTTTYRLVHNFGTPVRYWVVSWNHTTASLTQPTAGPNLRMDDTSDVNTLVLTSTVAGRAIVRVESAEIGVTSGP